MASIKLKFRTSSVQEKEGRLYYQVIHNRVVRQIHTAYRIYSSEWDADHSCIILPNSTTSKRNDYLYSLNETLETDRKKLLLVIARLDKEGQPYTADTVVECFHARTECQGIIGYTLELNEKLRRIGKKRMAARYTTTINSLQRCLKGGDVPLEEIDGTMIQGYEQWLKDSGLCRNTTSFYLRNLRTIYNHAVDDGVVISTSPFKHVYTGIDKTVKRARPLEIIKQLKKVGEMIGRSIPLTTYVARHSWASIAKSKNVPVSAISEALGHDSEKTTQIYLSSLDTSVVDNANNLIINSIILL